MSGSGQQPGGLASRDRWIYHGFQTKNASPVRPPGEAASRGGQGAPAGGSLTQRARRGQAAPAGVWFLG
jgi:hypothetical protein